MATENVDGEGGILSGNGIYWLAGGAAIIIVASVIYATYGTASTTKKEVVPVNPPNGDKGTDSNSTPTTPVQVKTVSGTRDYTSLPNAKALHPAMPDSSHGFTLGDDLTIRGGATVTRLDEGLNEKGTTKLTADTNLGKLWSNDVHAYVRAKDTFSYPFYKVNWEDINKKGTLVDKAKAEFSNLFGLSDVGYIGADGFGQL